LGFLTKKFRKTQPHLGSFTYKMAGEKEYEVPAYVPHLSYGELIEPLEDF
jgi:hypothetical protein